LKNVLRGFSSVGSVYPLETDMPRIKSETVSVEDAMREDWQRVGDDIRVAMHKFEDGQTTQAHK